MSNIDLHIGKRMLNRRRLLGMSQMQVALACGVGFQQVQKYESAYNKVSASRLWDIAKALGVSVEYFYEGL